MSENKDEIISAFAFKTGKEIEKLILETTNNLQERNKDLEARILSFRQKLEDRSYKMDAIGREYNSLLGYFDAYFNITINNKGK